MSKLDPNLKLIDDATTAVGAKVTALRDQIKQGMTATEVADAQAFADRITARLTSIAHDPEDPVPDAPPLEA